MGDDQHTGPDGRAGAGERRGRWRTGRSHGGRGRVAWAVAALLSVLLGVSGASAASVPAPAAPRFTEIPPRLTDGAPRVTGGVPRVTALAPRSVAVGGPVRRPPVDGEVVGAYVAPRHEYGPGHRGVDLAAEAGEEVRSPAAGTVTFAGQVAGRGVVVVEHADGTLTSLEPVSAALPRGAVVGTGSVVAVVTSPPHARCPTACVHWGVRVRGRYVDPLWWLGRGRAVRLLPIAGPWWTPSAGGQQAPRPTVTRGASRGTGPGAGPGARFSGR